MDDTARARIEAATVKLPVRGGQGVLVPGGYILTAAHCVEWSTEGSMALGDTYLQRIQTADGELLVATPCAVEPVSDIAALGVLDGQSAPQEADAFEEFCDKVSPVPICVDDYKFGQYFPVYIYTHKGEWISGRAARFGLFVLGTLFVKPDADIEGGTSGSPVVNDRGQLVALVSNAGGLAGDVTDSMVGPRPHLALPGWIWARISTAVPE
jgi:S1-C subfamily serine protease